MISPMPELTFGVEMEAIVHAKLPATAARARRDVVERKIYDQVRQCLRSAGAPANQDLTYLRPSDNLDGRYNRWTVEDDFSIVPRTLSVPGQLYVSGIEMVSRKLPFTDAAYEEVRLALLAARSNVELYTNPTCALHIHVGHSDDSLIPFHVAKNLVLTFLTPEGIIDSMSDPEYLDADSCGYYCPPISSLPEFEGQSTFEMCLEVWGTNSIEELVALLNPWVADEERFVALNMLGINPGTRHTQVGGKKLKPSIEFRRFAASVDAEEITNFLKSVHHLICFCAAASDSNMWQLISLARIDDTGLSSINKGFMTLRLFLEFLRLEPNVVHFFTRRDFRERYEFEELGLDIEADQLRPRKPPGSESPSSDWVSTDSEMTDVDSAVNSDSNGSFVGEA